MFKKDSYVNILRNSYLGVETEMLLFNEPRIDDGEWISECVKVSGYMGSDASFANIYLLKSKYSTKVAYYKGFLIRYYEGQGSRKGYTFPLGEGDVTKAIEAIKKDAKENMRKLDFCFVTEEQKSKLEEIFGEELVYTRDDGDSDYIYGQQELSLLSGKSYHKKKNHVSKFKRTYPDFEYCEIGKGNIEDAMLVEDAWYYEHLQNEDKSAMAEYAAIKEALKYFDELKLKGGIIYANNVPVAMTISSYINDNTVDIHFEKCIGEYALNGGFAAINQLHAQALKGVEYINREEDINIAGLRKAKESYHPKMMLKKYSATER